MTQDPQPRPVATTGVPDGKVRTVTENAACLNSRRTALEVAELVSGSATADLRVRKIMIWRDGGGVATAFDYPDTGKGGRGNRPSCSAGTSETLWV
jgi:hypothetical protein